LVLFIFGLNLLLNIYEQKYIFWIILYFYPWIKNMKKIVNFKIFLISLKLKIRNLNLNSWNLQIRRWRGEKSLYTRGIKINQRPVNCEIREERQWSQLLSRHLNLIQKSLSKQESKNSIKNKSVLIYVSKRSTAMLLKYGKTNIKRESESK